MSILIKVCGVSTAEAVDAAVEAGAGAVGFVFHATSPRNIAPRRAAALARSLPRGVLCVAVTLRPHQTLIDAILESLAPDVWQSDAADFDTIRLPATIARWPVVRGPAPPAPGLRRVLFESPASGTGTRANWRAAAVMARSRELILGGGLDAANVAAAIAAVRPFGVDVSSGVERSPGVKDAGRIRGFAAAVRGAMQAQSA